mmetsp:Transcript_78443/g.239990  ORF Transcript_78443/g.239990 Transcript_78443/m.239990 type:complete len:218 (+) Transcript_78443:686-1339(+)
MSSASKRAWCHWPPKSASTSTPRPLPVSEIASVSFSVIRCNASWQASRTRSVFLDSPSRSEASMSALFAMGSPKMPKAVAADSRTSGFSSRLIALRGVFCFLCPTKAHFSASTARYWSPLSRAGASRPRVLAASARLFGSECFFALCFPGLPPTNSLISVSTCSRSNLSTSPTWSPSEAVVSNSCASFFTSGSDAWLTSSSAWPSRACNWLCKFAST